MKQKNILVSWSGGLDSTYLIQMLLQQGHRVDAVYSKISNNIDKSELELKAIEKMIPIFKHHFQDRFNFVNEDNQFNIITIRSGIFSLSQTLYWLMSLYHSLNYGYDEVNIGYILGDDDISFLPEIRKVWKSFKPFIQELPKLEFPLIHTTKPIIYQKLLTGLKEHLHWCEMPEDGKQCGKCVPCRNMQYRVFDYLSEEESIDKVDEEIIKEVIARLYSKRNLDTV